VLAEALDPVAVDLGVSSPFFVALADAPEREFALALPGVWKSRTTPLGAATTGNSVSR
jgi:hypothetical protein